MWKEVIYLLSHYGIAQQTSCTNTPQQNGRNEWKHRQLLAITRALRFQSSIPIFFFFFLGYTVCWLSLTSSIHFQLRSWITKLLMNCWVILSWQLKTVNQDNKTSFHTNYVSHHYLNHFNVAIILVSLVY